MDSLWCCRHNSILPLGTVPPEEFRPRNLALVPCTREDCPDWDRWPGTDCIFIVRSHTPGRSGG